MAVFVLLSSLAKLGIAAHEPALHLLPVLIRVASYLPVELRAEQGLPPPAAVQDNR